MPFPISVQGYFNMASATFAICVFTHSVDEPKAFWNSTHHLGAFVLIWLATSLPIAAIPDIIQVPVSFKASLKPCHHFEVTDAANPEVIALPNAVIPAVIQAPVSLRASLKPAHQSEAVEGV